MNKKYRLKLHLPAQQASIAPVVGPILGQHGLKAQEFVQAFNNATSKITKGTEIAVIIVQDKHKENTMRVGFPTTRAILKCTEAIQKDVSFKILFEIAMLKAQQDPSKAIRTYFLQEAGAVLSMNKLPTK